jgi:hypothetical protein
MNGFFTSFYSFLSILHNSSFFFGGYIPSMAVNISSTIKLRFLEGVTKLFIKLKYLLGTEKNRPRHTCAYIIFNIYEKIIFLSG